MLLLKDGTLLRTLFRLGVVYWLSWVSKSPKMWLATESSRAVSFASILAFLNELPLIEAYFLGIIFLLKDYFNGVLLPLGFGGNIWFLA